MSEPQLALSVVVPVYEGAATVDELVRRLHLVLEPLTSALEVILVDDGSVDDSWARIQALARHDTAVRGLRHARNFGQHNALLTGIRAATQPLIITIDDDLQNPPEELPKLLAHLTPELDVVYGARERERHGLMRNLASRLTKVALRSAMGVAIASEVTAVRLFRTRLRDAFADYRSPFVSIDVLLSWGTSHFGAVKIRHDDRQQGKSNYTLRKLVNHALNMIVGFSIKPLRFASLLGFATVVFGILVLGWVIGRYIYQGGDGAVPGFPFLASTIAIFSGIQLFAIGVIGEYLARMHSRSTGRPTAVVSETTGEPDA